jgi:hypothetical protein
MGVAASSRLTMRTLAVLVLAASFQAAAPAVPVEPIGALLEKFQSYAVVALGEGPHGDLNSLKFRLALIRDPRFSQTVNDIVVEAGNSRYQDRIDAYVRGDEVPAAIVREACRNTTNPNTGSDYPSFEEIFHAVRDVNLTLPAERRVRILLGDPPFDWSAVRSVADLARPGGIMTADRDKFVADLVVRETIARKRRALMVYGDMHYRRSDKASIVSQLENAGVKVFSVWTTSAAALSFGQSNTHSWPVPSLAVIGGTALGQAMVPMWHPWSLEKQVDAVLNLGTFSPGSIPRAYCDDPDYMKMRLFRMDLRGEGDRLRRFCGLVK